jgi:hypothetical protein
MYLAQGRTHGRCALQHVCNMALTRHTGHPALAVAVGGQRPELHLLLSCRSCRGSMRDVEWSGGFAVWYAGLAAASCQTCNIGVDMLELQHWMLHSQGAVPHHILTKAQQQCQSSLRSKTKGFCVKCGQPSCLTCTVFIKSQRGRRASHVLSCVHTIPGYNQQLQRWRCFVVTNSDEKTQQMLSCCTRHDTSLNKPWAALPACRISAADMHNGRWCPHTDTCLQLRC